MRWLHRLRALLRNLFRRSTVDRDLNEELASYVELAAEEGTEQGVPAEAARRRARVQLGGSASVTESVRANRAGAGLERCWQDVRYAVRGLGRAPGYTIAVILTLGLGVGASTAVFAVVDAALFKPLPYSKPEQLVLIVEVFRRGTTEQVRQIGTTWAQVDHWRAAPRIFSSIATFMDSIPVRVDGSDAQEQASISRISPDLMATLGVKPVLGRGFLQEDVATGTTVMLAEEYWKSAFNGERAIVGQTIRLDSKSYTVIGVAPATMRWEIGGPRVIAWLPLDERVQRRVRPPFVGSIARLRDGLTVDQARREITQSLAERPMRTYDADLMPLDSRPGLQDAEEGHGMALAALLGAVSLVLLIGCANAASMILIRLVARRREISVRAALGATRGRLFRQFLTEGSVLVVAGAVCALALAFWTASVVPAVVPPQLGLFNANPLVIDARTLAAFGVSLVACVLLCAVVPALRASRRDQLSGLAGSARIAESRRGGYLGVLLQAGQLALTVVLLAGASLLAVSFIRMVQTDDGYDADRLVAASLALSTNTDASMFEELLVHVQAIPGVRVAYGSPPSDGGSGRLVAFGREAERGFEGIVDVFHAGPGYFAIAGVSLKAGRFLDDSELAGDETVGLIDERAADLLWPGQSAIGERFRYSPSMPWVTVVGVVGHVKTRWFTSPNGTIQAYVPLVPRGPALRYRTLLVRTDDVSGVVGPVTAVLRAAGPAIQSYSVFPVRDRYKTVFVGPRLFLVLMLALAVLGLVTASVGLYGAVCYAVTQRTREIGVRIALGANLGRVRRLVLREAMMPMVLGVIGGLVGAWWLTRYLSSLLYQTPPHDPLAFGAMLVVLMCVAALAAYIPARRATRINPVETLRAE
jgi:predicted permease